MSLGTLASSVVVLVLLPVAFVVSEELKGMISDDKEEAVPPEEPELDTMAASLRQKA
ncbi:MAG: hypothetical protein MKZ70_08465 [Opitutales bacterium]|nr:hypothetical protein [Opitutales bacterium]